MPWTALHPETLTDAEAERLDSARTLAALGEPPAAGGAGAQPPPYVHYTDSYIGSESRTRVPDGAGREARRAVIRSKRAEKRAIRWNTLRTLRAGVEDQLGVIVDGHGIGAACHDYGRFEHRRTESGELERRFAIHSCHVRSRCPICSATYAESRGDELVSLVHAAVDGADLRPSDPIAWALEVTLPAEASAWGNAALLRGDAEAARWLASALSRVTEDIARAALDLIPTESGPSGADADLAIAMSVQAFHSEYPATPGGHWHTHSVIPNRGADGRPLRHLGNVPEESLEALRAYASARIRRALQKRIPLAAYTPNLRLQWQPNSPKGRRELTHRTRYLTRSPWQDVADQVAADPERGYSDRGMQLLRTFAIRYETLHTAIRTVRYRGWLWPGRARGAEQTKREAAGLHRIAPEPTAPWESDDTAWTILRATPEGLIVRRAREHDQQHLVEWSEVRTSGNAPPPKWRGTET